MSTKVQIISNAISVMGHKPIQTLLNGDDMVVSAEQAFDMLLPSILSRAQWRFAVQIQQLTLLNETPISNTWSHVFSLPAGWLKTIRIHPQTYDWEIFESKKLYTNFNGAWYMEYVFQPVITLLPPSFVEYFIYEIAAYLALANAQKPEFFETLTAKALQMQGFAAAIDAQNRPSTSQVTFPVLNNRNFATAQYTFN